LILFNFQAFLGTKTSFFSFLENEIIFSTSLFHKENNRGTKKGEEVMEKKL
jgi:hypothetical protein